MICTTLVVIWTNADVLSIRSLSTIFGSILIKIQRMSLNKNKMAATLYWTQYVQETYHSQPMEGPRDHVFMNVFTEHGHNPFIIILAGLDYSWHERDHLRHNMSSCFNLENALQINLYDYSEVGPSIWAYLRVTFVHIPHKTWKTKRTISLVRSWETVPNVCAM